MKNYLIHKTFFKAADFIQWKKNGNLFLSPEFQRRSVWKLGAKSFLIDTMIKGLPIPIIFLRDRKTDPKKLEPIREVIDGQQRLRTLLSFIAPNLVDNFNLERDQFTIKKAHNKELAGKTFVDLDDDVKQRILDYEFSIHILPSHVDDREIIQIFRRINSTNYSLNKQELRNAQFFGEFKSSMYKLAEEQLNTWRKWKSFTEDDIARMHEVEFVNECVITMMSQKISGRSSSQFDNAYEKYDEDFRQRKEIERRFREVIELIDKEFIDKVDDFILCKKTILYTFFVFMYDSLFNLDSTLKTNVKAKKLDQAFFDDVKMVNEKLRERTAPERILNSIDRRTTNPKERTILFKYLKSSTK